MSELDQRVEQVVFGDDGRATTDAQIAEAVTNAMTYSGGPDGTMGFRWNGVAYDYLRYGESRFGFEGMNGNDGYGWYFWRNRHNADYRADIEAHVANYRRRPRAYSASWRGAQYVVERMKLLGYGMVHWNHWMFSSAGRGHNVAFYKGVHPPAWPAPNMSEGDKGLSFPVAVCEAALLAVPAEQLTR